MELGKKESRRLGALVGMLVVGLVMGSVMLSPVGAHISNFNHLRTKHFYTKKAADNRFISVGEKATSATEADNAATATVAKNIMGATVPVGNSCTITTSTGGVSATMVGNTCDVTFPRSIDNCVVGATVQHPFVDVGGEVSIRKLSGTTVKVARFDSAGGTPTAGLFSILAVCPT